MSLLSTSCLSSEPLIVKDKKGYLIRNAAKSVDKVDSNKVFKLVACVDDAVLTMTAANQTKILGNNLLIYPTFWDPNAKLECKLVYRDKIVTVFEVTQLSNKRLGYVIGAKELVL